MPGDITSRHILSNDDMLEMLNIDRFRPTLKCDLFIPSFVHSLSLATEFVSTYVLDRFPDNFFNTIHISGKHALEDFRKINRGNLAKRENPSLSVSYNLQYDFNDNNLDFNLLSINKYLKKSQWQRSFFKDPKNGLYIGMDLECMLITYNFRFKVNTRAEQLDLFNRIRKIFRVGCTETNDIDVDFHLDRDLITHVAQEAGFAVDTNGEVLDTWNFNRYLNSKSQMPILYKLRGINQKHEHFVRMRNLPVHMDFQNQLDVDDGSQVGMTTTDFTIDFQITVRFPCPRTFQLYNEGLWRHDIKLEKNEGITVFSMKVYDIPEQNEKGWPLYGHSNYMAEEDEKIVESIDITDLFKAPPDIRVGSSLNDIIDDSLAQFISPDSFIEIAVYTNDYMAANSGRIPIKMDWEKKKIILPKNTVESYFYIAIYIDREYVNSKIVELTNADENRIKMSRNDHDQLDEEAIHRNNVYEENHLIENEVYPNTNLPKKGKKARFVVTRGR